MRPIRAVISLFLLLRNLQHLSGIQHIAFQSVKFDDLRVATALAEIRLRNLPKRIAVFDCVRSAGVFGFRRGRLGCESVIVLLHRCQERTPVGQDIPALVKFANQKESRIPGLAAHALFSISTGKLEGFNNKIKVAKRIGYGYRDEDFFFTLIRYLSLPRSCLHGIP